MVCAVIGGEDCAHEPVDGVGSIMLLVLQGVIVKYGSSCNVYTVCIDIQF